MEDGSTIPLDTWHRHAMYPDSGSVVDETYRVGTVLGSGSYGVVVRATDMTLERDVALKFVNEEYASEGSKQHFLNEARAMAQVNHPNVVGIHGVGQWRGTPYLVMEYIDGRSLQAVLQNRGDPLAPNEAMAYFEQICRGVEAIHARGTTHNDLKPSNILLGTPARVAITDFGLAERGDSTNRGGTLGFSAPESMEARSLDLGQRRRADIYSLAVVGWMLFTGEAPFSGDPDTVIAAQRGGPPAWLVDEARLPRTFGRLLRRALSPDASERQDSARALLGPLSRALAKHKRWTPIPRRVAVIEDDGVQRQWLERALDEVIPLAEIELYADAESALGELIEHPPDLLITDLGLPGLSGFDVVQRVRAEHRWANVPIVAITAHAEPVDWARLTAMGADAFLPKPLKLTALRATTQRMLSRR